MNNFNLQIKLLKFCGLERFPSQRMEILSEFLLFCVVLISFYSLILSVSHIMASKNIHLVFDILTKTVMVLIFVMKYISLYWNKEEIFNILHEINALNEKCEKIFFPSFLEGMKIFKNISREHNNLLQIYFVQSK